jgi:hypothetical protein
LSPQSTIIPLAAFPHLWQDAPLICVGGVAAGPVGVLLAVVETEGAGERCDKFEAGWTAAVVLGLSGSASRAGVVDACEDGSILEAAWNKVLR